MIIEYYDEFKRIPNLYIKQVEWFDRWIRNNNILQNKVYEKIDEFFEETPYTTRTKRAYRIAMRHYIEAIARKYWR